MKYLVGFVYRFKDNPPLFASEVIEITGTISEEDVSCKTHQSGLCRVANAVRRQHPGYEGYTFQAIMGVTSLK